MQPVFDAAGLGAGGRDQTREERFGFLDLSTQGAQVRNDGQLFVHLSPLFLL